MKTVRPPVLLLCVMLALTACDTAQLPTATIQWPQDVVRAESGWVFAPNGEPIQVRFVNDRGEAVLEGDILLGPAASIAKTRAELLGVRAGNDSVQPGSVIDSYEGSPWASGVVPYVIASGFTSAEVDTIMKGMNIVTSQAAGLQFVPRTTESWWFVVSKADSANDCRANVGNRRMLGLTPANHQRLQLGENCLKTKGPGVVAHELLHTLGMWHEQGRCDRDAYVSINFANIEGGSSNNNFDKHCPNGGFFWQTGGGRDVYEYDEGSLMHYGAYLFAINPSIPTIYSLRGASSLMGNRDSLSTIDGQTLNSVYTPWPVQPPTITYPGSVVNLSWPAYGRRSLGVSVSLVVMYEEYDDYNDESYIDVYDTEAIGFTTGSSIVDSSHPFTNKHECVLYQSVNGSARYAYYYEFVAVFAGGITSTPRLWPAYVAPC